MKHLAYLVFVWILLWSGRSEAEEPLPASPSPLYVRDDAKWLQSGAIAALDEKLKDFEKETSSQLVVGIFPRLPERAELVDFSQRLFEYWKPGGEARDNGVLLLFFADDRKIRIHTGYGLEGALPDALAARIIREEIVPRMREGNREVAVNAGVDAIIAATKGEYVGTGKTRLEDERKGTGSWIVFVIVGFVVLGFFFPRVFMVADVIFSAMGPMRSGGGWTGGGSSGGGWSGGGGGFSGGGGGSGGGFSGGGGSSGGGGASGEW